VVDPSSFGKINCQPFNLSSWCWSYKVTRVGYSYGDTVECEGISHSSFTTRRRTSIADVVGQSSTSSSSRPSQPHVCVVDKRPHLTAKLTYLAAHYTRCSNHTPTDSVTKDTSVLMLLCHMKLEGVTRPAARGWRLVQWHDQLATVAPSFIVRNL
jgi:hypothetical protein